MVQRTGSRTSWAWSDMSGWKNSNRRQELPHNWHKLRARAKLLAGDRCEHRSEDGVRCSRKGTDADHAGDRMDHWTLQWLCPVHHNRKTGEESREGKRAKRRKGERKRRDDRPGAL